LKAISQWLDRQRALVSLVASDLRHHGLRETGRRGLPAETVLHCALLKQQRQLGYEELAFHLEDSAFRGRGGLMTFKIGSQLRRATSCLPAKRVRQLS
jgi:IS5 family transposase